jgi:hypothetical protein
MKFKRPQCFVCGAYEPTTAFGMGTGQFVWACGKHREAVVDLGETILRDGYADAREWERKWNLPETSKPMPSGQLTSLASKMDLPTLTNESKTAFVKWADDLMEEESEKPGAVFPFSVT